MATIRLEILGIGFEWDDAKQSQVEVKHQITFEEACAVFFDENEITFEDTRFKYKDL